MRSKHPEQTIAQLLQLSLSIHPKLNASFLVRLQSIVEISLKDYNDARKKYLNKQPLKVRSHQNARFKSKSKSKRAEDERERERERAQNKPQEKYLDSQDEVNGSEMQKLFLKAVQLESQVISLKTRNEQLQEKLEQISSQNRSLEARNSSTKTYSSILVKRQQEIIKEVESLLKFCNEILYIFENRRKVKYQIESIATIDLVNLLSRDVQQLVQIIYKAHEGNLPRPQKMIIEGEEEEEDEILLDGLI